MIGLCNTSTCFTQIEHYAQLIIVVSYIFMIISQIFAFYWHANEVREESMAIGEAAYSGPWIELDQASKKKLLLVILRSQVPLEVFINKFIEEYRTLFKHIVFADIRG